MPSSSFASIHTADSLPAIAFEALGSPTYKNHDVRDYQVNCVNKRCSNVQGKFRQYYFRYCQHNAH